MKSVLIVMIILLSFINKSFGQSDIRGKVVDDNGRGIYGVTIEYPNGRVMTDSLGFFNISGSYMLPLTILIKHIGYEELTYKISDYQPELLTVELSQIAEHIDEVLINTGYQSIAKERSSGSFVTIARSKLNEQVGINILSRLEGVASSVVFDRATMGEEPQIMIRGISTIRGPRAPLIIVDNFPYDGDISNINPNDVENVTLLRDAAASSIWGTRAGNGVIVITTKKSSFNQPLRVEFNTAITAGGRPDLSTIPQMSSSDYIDVEQMLFERGFYTSRINSRSRLPLTPVVEVLLKESEGLISAAEAREAIDNYRLIDIRNEFSKHMYRSSLNQQYSLSFSGGGGQGHWQLSTAYDNNMNETYGRFERLNARFQKSLKFGNSVELSSGILYTRILREAGRPGYGDISHYSTYRLYPYAQFSDDFGNPIAMVRDYRRPHLDTLGGGMLLDWQYFPSTDHEHTTNTSSTHDLLVNVDLRVNLLKGLSADIRYQYQGELTENMHHRNDQSYFARHTINRFSQIDPVTGLINRVVPPGGVLDVSKPSMYANNLRGQLNFDRQWKSHRVDAIGGFEARDRRIAGLNMRYYGYDDDILTYNNVDFTRTYPLLIGGGQSYIPNYSDLTGRTERYVSMFANIAYTYANQYTLTMSARRDASNMFGVREIQRWQPLWSAGFAWNISASEFYDWDWLPYLKFRANYGKSGNVDQSQTAVTTMAYWPSNSPYTMLPSARFVTYANPDLKWENVAMMNLGLDFSSNNNRLTGSVEYYLKRGSDLFGVELIDYTSGTDYNMIRNAASINGRGLDIILNSHNIIKGGFNWSTNLNFSISNEKVRKHYLPVPLGRNYVQGIPISAEPGRAVYGIYSFDWRGLDPSSGDPQGLLSGEISKDYTAILSNTELSDMIYHGSALPTIFGNIGNQFKLGQFSLSISINYKLGYYFRNNSIRYQNLYNSGLGHPDFEHRWQNPGDERYTNVPSMIYPANSNRDAFHAGSEILIEKADHVRLQYINLSYECPPTVFPKLNGIKLHLYANASNLGIIWRANKTLIDPDYGVRMNSMSPPKMFSFGLRINY